MDEDLSQIVCVPLAPALATQERPDAVRSAASVADVTVFTGGHLYYPPHNNFPLTVNKFFYAVGSSDALSLHNRWSDGNAVKDEKRCQRCMHIHCQVRNKTPCEEKA